LRPWKAARCAQRNPAQAGSRNTDELHHLVSRVMVRRQKKDVLQQLPPKRRHKVRRARLWWRRVLRRRWVAPGSRARATHCAGLQAPAGAAPRTARAQIASNRSKWPANRHKPELELRVLDRALPTRAPQVFLDLDQKDRRALDKLKDKLQAGACVDRV
jgi:hypothetical protein